MALKDLLNKAGSAIKNAVTKVTTNIKNVASKVVETVSSKSEAIVQTVASACTGNIAGVVSGVASIVTPTKKNNDVVSTGVVVSPVVENKKASWKDVYNNYTSLLVK